MLIKEQVKPGKVVSYFNNKLESRTILTQYPEIISDLMVKRMDTYGKKVARIEQYLFKDKPMIVRNFTSTDKGSYTWFHEHPLPARNIHLAADLDAAFIWKRAITFLFQFIAGNKKNQKNFKKKNPIQKLFILLSVLINYELYRKFIHHSLSDKFYDPPEKYCQPTRELYRVMSDFPMERDIICFFLDADHAYLYRFQDIAVELNKTAFKKNPLKETMRLIDLMIEREPFTGERGMRDKMRMAKKVLVPAYLYLRIFKRKTLKKLLKVVEDLNIDEIKPSKEDLYWMNRAQSYNFGGLSHYTRKEILQ